MGFAYAQGIIETLKASMPDIKLGGYYIIAPENASGDTVNPNDFSTQVWQYGSDELNHPVHKQDGVAPQRTAGGLTRNNRAFIPDSEKQGFVTSHSIGNYKWIFTKTKGENGYVTPRK